MRPWGSMLPRMEKKALDKGDGEKLIVKNRRAFFDYAAEEQGEVWLKQMYIAPFEQASAFPHEPRRARKVLLHKHEIDRLHDASARGGYTIVPLRLYFKRGRVKVELGVGKGKKH